MLTDWAARKTIHARGGHHKIGDQTKGGNRTSLKVPAKIKTPSAIEPLQAQISGRPEVTIFAVIVAPGMGYRREPLQA